MGPFAADILTASFLDSQKLTETGTSLSPRHSARRTSAETERPGKLPRTAHPGTRKRRRSVPTKEVTNNERRSVSRSTRIRRRTQASPPPNHKPCHATTPYTYSDVLFLIRGSRLFVIAQPRQLLSREVIRALSDFARDYARLCPLFTNQQRFFWFLHFSFTWELAFAFATTHQPLIAKRWFWYFIWFGFDLGLGHETSMTWHGMASWDGLGLEWDQDGIEVGWMS